MFWLCHTPAASTFRSLIEKHDRDTFIINRANDSLERGYEIMVLLLVNDRRKKYGSRLN